MKTIDTTELLDRLGIAGGVAGADEGFVSENPATGRPLARIRRAASADYEAVVAAAQAAFLKWREVPAPRRGEMIRCLGEQLRRHKDLLGTLISLETGKIKAEGDGEVQETIDIADFAVGLSRQLYGSTMHSERARHRMFEQWHPLGPVGIVTAFNFPAAVWAWNAFIAAVCGDTTVWKPSSKAPLTALAIHRLAGEVARQHDAPDVFGLIVSDDAVVGERLAGDARLPLLSFTGSSAVGRRVASTVATRFGRSLLECSGNNAVIVDESADLDLATRAIVFGAVGTAGQRCTSTRRLIVHESRYPEVVRRLRAAYGQVCIDDPLSEGTLMGPLIDAAARDAFVAAVAEARACGGELLFGGGVLAGPGYFVQPTLIAAENHWPLVQRETFAPILA